MLVLFIAADPAFPESMREILLNVRQVVSVEPTYRGVKAGGESFNLPDGSLITLIDKRKLRVQQTPREVQRSFETRGAR